MKSVYACFSTDVIHEGHLHIIQEAQAYGELTIGVLTDEALIKFDRFPGKRSKHLIRMMMVVLFIMCMVMTRMCFFFL